MDFTSKVKSNFHQMWKKEKSVIIFLMTGAAIITGLFVPKQHRAFILKKKKLTEDHVERRKSTQLLCNAHKILNN